MRSKRSYAREKMLPFLNLISVYLCSCQATSKAMPGNMEAMFGHVRRVYLFQFTTFKYPSRRSILKIVTSGVMSGNMEAMFKSLSRRHVPQIVTSSAIFTLFQSLWSLR